MKLTRQEDVSLYLHIRDRVIGPQYSELAENYTLVSGTGAWDIPYETSLEIYPFKRDGYSGLGRGLVYFDMVGDDCCFGVEQTNMITISDGVTTLINGSDYYINYLTGQVHSILDLSTFSVDYHWNYVSVLDAWPSDDVPALPIVSIELQRGESLPLQLGGGDIRDGEWNIEIFANNKGERDDLMDVIYEGVYNKRCPIYLFSTGLPLLRSGLFNPAFILEEQPNYPHLTFENVEKSLTSLPRWGFYENEVINKFRASISFRTLAYKK